MSNMNFSKHILAIPLGAEISGNRYQTILAYHRYISYSYIPNVSLNDIYLNLS